MFKFCVGKGGYWEQLFLKYPTALKYFQHCNLSFSASLPKNKVFYWCSYFLQTKYVVFTLLPHKSSSNKQFSSLGHLFTGFIYAVNSDIFGVTKQTAMKIWTFSISTYYIYFIILLKLWSYIKLTCEKFLYTYL